MITHTYNALQQLQTLPERYVNFPSCCWHAALPLCLQIHGLSSVSAKPGNVCIVIMILFCLICCPTQHSSPPHGNVLPAESCPASNMYCQGFHMPDLEQIVHSVLASVPSSPWNKTWKLDDTKAQHDTCALLKWFEPCETDSIHSLIILDSLFKTWPHIFRELSWVLLAHTPYVLPFSMIHIAKIVQGSALT
jgi:hypothetical protein